MEFSKTMRLVAVGVLTFAVAACSGADEPGSYQERAEKAPLEPVVSSIPPGVYYRVGQPSDDPQLNDKGLPKFASTSLVLAPAYSYKPVEQGARDEYKTISELMDVFWIFHSYRQWPLSAGAIWGSLPKPSTRNNIPDVLRPEGLYWKDYQLGVAMSGEKEMELSRFFTKWINENRVEDHRLFRVDFHFASDVYRGFNTATDEIVFKEDLFNHTENAYPTSYQTGAPRVGFRHEERELVRVTVEDSEAIEALNQLQTNVDVSIYAGLAALSQSTEKRVPGGRIGLIFDAHFVEFKNKETGELIYTVQL